MKRSHWSRDEALVFLAALAPLLREAGFGVALGGSVLVRGESSNDLDVVVFPFTTERFELGAARIAFQVLGMRPLYTEETVKKRWRQLGSNDMKHVEIWEHQNKRIDIFFLK